MRSANLNVVALVIHDHAGTHVPVQYIQAYIQALLTQLEYAHGMRTLGDWGLFYSKTRKHTCPICPMIHICLWGGWKGIYGRYCEKPIASTFMPGFIQVQVTV